MVSNTHVLRFQELAHDAWSASCKNFVMQILYLFIVTHSNSNQENGGCAMRQNCQYRYEYHILSKYINFISDLYPIIQSWSVIPFIPGFGLRASYLPNQPWTLFSTNCPAHEHWYLLHGLVLCLRGEKHFKSSQIALVVWRLFG